MRMEFGVLASRWPAVAGICLLLMFLSTGQAAAPTEVAVGLNVHQVTGIDQKAESFGVVAALQMKWHEPGLALKTGEKKPATRMYLVKQFTSLLVERGLLWPAYSFYNLQGRVDYQNQVITVDAQGNIIYVARFTGTFQAPDFDFNQFPLDHQNFYLKLDSLRPLSQIQFESISEFGGLGNALGEEEWILS